MQVVPTVALEVPRHVPMHLPDTMAYVPLTLLGFTNSFGTLYPTLVLAAGVHLSCFRVKMMLQGCVSL